MTTMGVTKWARAPLMVQPRRVRPLAKQAFEALFRRLARVRAETNAISGNGFSRGPGRPLNCCRLKYPRAECDRRRRKALSENAGMLSAMAVNVSARPPEIERPGADVAP